jgi:hypothetical protein
MVEQAGRPQCAIVVYGFGLDDIALDDAIDTAIAAQGSYAQRCVALPGKLNRQDWIAMVQANQGVTHAAGCHPLWWTGSTYSGLPSSKEASRLGMLRREVVTLAANERQKPRAAGLGACLCLVDEWGQCNGIG